MAELEELRYRMIRRINGSQWRYALSCSLFGVG